MQPAEVASSAQELSDFYVEQPGRPTPWGAGARAAYLGYFMPLNLLRLLRVFREVERFLPQDRIKQIVDIGSGMGAAHWCLEQQGWLAPRPFYCLERSEFAVKAHQELTRKFPCQWRPEWVSKAPKMDGALAVFSYAFVEAQDSQLNDFDHLLIVEPSTRDQGRKLMELRDRLLHRGYRVLAPCTHQLACPLLTQSARDWCHFRIPVELPPFTQQVESHLPMKNRSLTFSYLLVTRQSDVALRGSAAQTARPVRVLGDTLHERGKTRQLICRGPEREFLSWLRRNGEPQFIPSGALIADLGEIHRAGNELRPTQTLILEE